MRPLPLILLCLIAAPVYGEESSYDFRESRPVSFRTHHSTDYLEVSYTGTSCEQAVLKLTIYTSADEVIFENPIPYTPTLYDACWSPDFPVIVKNAFDYLLNNVMDTTSNLPKRLLCSQMGADCEYDFFPESEMFVSSDLSVEQYDEIRIRNLPNDYTPCRTRELGFIHL